LFEQDFSVCRLNTKHTFCAFVLAKTRMVALHKMSKGILFIDKLLTRIFESNIYFVLFIILLSIDSKVHIALQYL
jgi:hypothetical protein